MAIDIEAIKRKLAAMTTRGGDNGSSGVQQWKPEIGEYKVRLIPWVDHDPTAPLRERSFYFFGKFGCLVPSDGNDDPVNQLRMTLFQSAKKDESYKVLAKQLFAKTYWYAQIIVRGQEDKGLQVWKLSKMAALRLMGFLVDEDVGDIFDLNAGFDLKVKVSKTPGKDFLDTTIDAGRQCPATKDAAQLKEWTSKVIDIDDLHRNRFKTNDEIRSALDAWLDGGESAGSGNEVTKGGTPAKGLDELDALANEVSKPAKTEKKTEAKTPKKTHVDDDDDVPEVKTDLDSAFADLMSDDE